MGVACVPGAAQRILLMSLYGGILCCEPHHKRLTEKMLQFILSVCGWLPRPWATPEVMMTHGARGIAVKSERPMEF